MIKKAIRYAIKAHASQMRKGTDFPYIEHPIHVDVLLQQIGASEEVVVSGILHDTLEDTLVTEADILTEFGETVLSLIKGASGEVYGVRLVHEL
jgi:(p)ppGpp synthase/HD superfamily hydrolase